MNPFVIDLSQQRNLFLFLFLFLPIVLKVPLLARNTTLMLVLSILIGAPTTVENEQREAPLLALDETSKVLSLQ